jgi:uncharacterized cofD-like protein
MFDSGGSSGELREKFDILPPSDFTRAILAHAADNDYLERLLTARLPKDQYFGVFGGHTGGNLLYLALEGSGIQRADAVRIFVNALKNFKGFRGTPHPVSLERAHVITVLTDGSRHEGEAYLDHRKVDDVPISHIELNPPPIADVGAVEAVQKADLAVAAMGSFYGSTIATMLPLMMPEALSLAGGVAFPVPLMTMPNETHGYTPIDFVERLLRHIPSVKRLSALLVNDGEIPPEVEAKYAAESSVPVRITPEQKRLLEEKYCDKVICRNYIDENYMRANDGELRHDCEVLAEDLIRVAHSLHMKRREQRANEQGSVQMSALLKELDLKGAG